MDTSCRRKRPGASSSPLLQRRSREALLRALEQELTLRFAQVDEGALRARYETNPEYELTVRHLVILAEEWASEEEENEARSRAGAALERIRAGEPFPEVAGEFSQEPGAAERGGLLQPGRRDTWVPEFWRAASALDVGEVSPVIRTPYGFHVLKLVDREPVPFPEARRRVVDEVAGLLPPQPEAYRVWADSASASLEVDSTALRRVWESAGAVFPLTQLLGDSSSLVVATWPGGSYPGAQLRTSLVALERTEWERVEQVGFSEFLRVATDAARRSLLAEVARSMGVAASPGERKSLARDWETSVATWAQGLGFRQGMSPDALKAAAMEGVGSSGQGARLARDDLHARRPMLLSAYPVAGVETPLFSPS